MVENASTHPYLPVGLKLPCRYVENDKSILELLGVFFGLTAVVMVSTWIYSGSSAKVKLSTAQRLTVCWFMLCGCIHLILEGWFSVFHNSIAGDQSFLSQLWKEYSKADSRYVSADNFTVVMESITAFLEGPGSFLAAWAILENKPSRYLLQLLVSTGQLYGDILYYTIEYKDGFVHGPMWHPLYFWFYFMFLNSFWIVIPFCLLVQACGKVSQAQAVIDKTGTLGKKSK
ncbi:3-beta-hydroxysteroid-Delta(8),Delta(7)-isomerase-like isoform X1 [Branchiostoma floridae x Branchiostoma belcheri]